MVKSKFSYQIYLNSFVFLVSLFLCVYSFIHPEIYNKNKLGFKNPAVVFGIIFLFLAILLFYIVSKLTYIIKIEGRIIHIRSFFKTETLDASLIKSIDLFSKEDLYWSVGAKTVAISILLESGKKIVIADPFYSNIHEIKKCLQETFDEKITSFRNIKELHFTGTILENDYEKFSGNPHLSLSGLLFYGLTILFLFTIYKNYLSSPKAFLFLIPISIFYLALGYQLHYFLISNKHLIIKNHFLPWINKTYNIDDIVEVNFETPRKHSKTLRITTKNFKSKTYQAGSLREKNWNELKGKFKSMDIYFVEV